MITLSGRPATLGVGKYSHTRIDLMICVRFKWANRKVTSHAASSTCMRLNHLQRQIIQLAICSALHGHDEMQFSICCHLLAIAAKAIFFFVSIFALQREAFDRYTSANSFAERCLKALNRICDEVLLDYILESVQFESDFFRFI